MAFFHSGALLGDWKCSKKKGRPILAKGPIWFCKNCHIQYTGIIIKKDKGGHYSQVYCMTFMTLIGYHIIGLALAIFFNS